MNTSESNLTLYTQYSHFRATHSPLLVFVELLAR